MPAGDRTGPRGLGPMTGRGVGYCGGTGVPGNLSEVPGLGRGLGRGRGRGWRRRYYATGITGRARPGLPDNQDDVRALTPSPEQEIRLLEAQTDELQRSLAWVRSRLSRLQAGPPETGQSDGTTQ